jgi:UDP-2-acetamido-3-amino-2,3-dideoxy-glucuronate N-acetyltransferase
MPVATDVQLGEGVIVYHPDLVNLYGCKVGAASRIGAFVEIQAGAELGERCKIQSHAFICEGVVIEDEVFIGHGVMFTNDRYPKATTAAGNLKGSNDWVCETTRVARGASIGSNATILCPVSIGVGALIGAGAVVTCDVPDFAIVVGNPARIVRDLRSQRAEPRDA